MPDPPGVSCGGWTSASAAGNGGHHEPPSIPSSNPPSVPRTNEDHGNRCRSRRACRRHPSAEQKEPEKAHVQLASLKLRSPGPRLRTGIRVAPTQAARDPIATRTTRRTSRRDGEKRGLMVTTSQGNRQRQLWNLLDRAMSQGCGIFELL